VISQAIWGAFHQLVCASEALKPPWMSIVELSLSRDVTMVSGGAIKG